jgi:proteasome lid subunit RPN8/RPN11
MSTVRTSVRGYNVIVWSEQKPDFWRRPITDLVARLPFTSACAVLINDGESPKVVASQGVLDSIFSHLAERPVEMGGLLLGNVYNLADNVDKFVITISDHARSVDYEGTGVSLRMDTPVWENARLKSQDGCSVIGWYHSHPNLGAFFSGTDRRTQRAFFNHPHCIGLVIDPIRRDEKWFIGGESEELAVHQILRHRSPE